MPSKPTLVIIDDEPWQLTSVIRELDHDYTCLIINDPLEGAEFLQSNPDIAGLVLDIMMQSPDESLIEKTQGGLETGLWLLDHLSDILISGKLPVVVLSNRSRETVEKRVSELPYPEHQIKVLWKQGTSAPRIRQDVGASTASRKSLDGFRTDAYLNAFVGTYGNELDLLAKQYPFVESLLAGGMFGEPLSRFLGEAARFTSGEQCATNVFSEYIDLYRIPGIGPRNAALLITGADISDVSLLGKCDPDHLYWKLRNYNQHCQLYDPKFPPSRVQIHGWIEAADKCAPLYLSKTGVAKTPQL